MTSKPLQLHYYNGSIRNTIVAFGSLFTNIKVKKYKNPSDIGKTRRPNRSQVEEIEEKIVELEYGPQEKYQSLLSERETVEDIPRQPLPRIVFEITDIIYDASRKQATTWAYETKAQFPIAPILETSKTYQNFVPVPYTLSSQVNIFSRSEDDTWQIIEQILPLFQPDYTVPVTMNNDTKEKRDVIVTHKGISISDQWKGDFNQRRYLLYTLTFDIKTYIYGPVSISKNIDTDIKVNFEGQF